MKKYFNTVTYITTALSIIFGYLAHSVLEPNYQFVNKNYLALVSILASIVIYITVDYFAVKKIKIKTRIDMRWSANMKVFIIEAVLILLGLYFVFIRYEINSAIKYILFPAVVTLFVGAFYESIRQLRSKE